MVLPANHWLYQLANVCLFFSFVSSDALFLRIVLAIAGLLFVLWGSVVLDTSLDTCLWNAVFLAINTIFAVKIIFSRRPIQFQRVEHERLYNVLFLNAMVPKMMLTECRVSLSTLD